MRERTPPQAGDERQAGGPIELRPSLGVLPPTARGLHRPEAARYVGVSVVTFDKLIREGVMPRPKRIGGRLVWDRYALDMAFDALDGGEPARHDGGSPEGGAGGANPWDDLK